MTKMETIAYEWDHKHQLSPKSFGVTQKFLKFPAKHLGKRYVYNNTNKRDVLLYESINLEKYYYHTEKESDHPFSPQLQPFQPLKKVEPKQPLEKVVQKFWFYLFIKGKVARLKIYL